MGIKTSGGKQIRDGESETAMNQDKFNIEILPDGSMKITTDKVSDANHVQAENLIKEMFRLAGGEVEIKHRHGKQQHVHRFASADAVVLEHGHKH